MVSADNSSLPEVVGNAGLLVSAGDSETLAGAMAQLLSDGELRERLGKAGQERARQFTWEAAAQQLLETYHSFRIAISDEQANPSRPTGNGN